MSLAELWPLFGVRVATPTLELRIPNDDELAAVVELAREGIHDPATMPFAVPWTDLPSPEFERSALRYHWHCRADLTPAHWDIGFAVFVDGDVVGMQGLRADDFPSLRRAETGSWLGRRYQSKGIGSAMRRAVVHFAFEALGAECITSGAWADNAASQNVSLAVGYERNGTDRMLRRGVPADHVRFVLTRDRWASQPSREPVEVHGFDDACRSMLGL